MMLNGLKIFIGAFLLHHGVIFVVVDRLITGKLTVYPWKRKDAVENIEDQNKMAEIKSLWGEFILTVFPKKRKDADKKVVNEERDSY